MLYHVTRIASWLNFCHLVVGYVILIHCSFDYNIFFEHLFIKNKQIILNYKYMDTLIIVNSFNSHYDIKKAEPRKKKDNSLSTEQKQRIIDILNQDRNNFLSR
jgi:hypothetical protein